MLSPMEKPFGAFDPDGPAVLDGIYGLPHTPEEAAVVLIPVPWEATVSSRAGAADGPRAILEASRQVDLFDRETGRPYEDGIALLPIPEEVRAWSDAGRALVRAEGSGAAAPQDETQDMTERTRRVDALGERVNEHVRALASGWLDRGRLVGVLGGDHSSPFGLIQELAQRRHGLGILQVDAHADLRRAYEGFRWSHASIFDNVLREIPGVARLVQVGVRDLGASEDARIRGSAGRIVTFFDPDLQRRLCDGEPWARIARGIVESLPPEVYISFDIDGLDPSLCPNTGTPVPGGLSWSEAVALLRELAASGRRIVGFDLCETAPGPDGNSGWDGTVAARLLYKMIGFARFGSVT